MNPNTLKYSLLLLLTVASCAWRTESRNPDGGGTDGEIEGNDSGDDIRRSKVVNEGRISTLGEMLTYDAAGDYAVYTDLSGRAYLINFNTMVEERMDDPFLKDLRLYYPSISGSRIAFEAVKKSDPSQQINVIAIFDLATREGRIIPTPDSAEPIELSIYGDMIVWTDYRHFDFSTVTGNVDVFGYDLAREMEIRITDDPARQRFPRMHGNHVVWLDARNCEENEDDEEVYLYDLTTGEERNISNHPSLQLAPDVWGNGVVWTDLRNGEVHHSSYANADVYYHNIETGQTLRITDDPADQESARISGRYIFWNDLRNGGRYSNGYPYGADVYLYDLETAEEKRITWDPANDYAARVAGERILWISQRDGELALYTKLLSYSLRPLADP